MTDNRSSDVQVYYSGSLTKQEIIELAKLKDEGDTKAREKLILSHLWLVQKIVTDKIASSEIATDKKELYAELYQEGCLGLVEAVDKFDWRRNVVLSTYVFYTIRKYVLKYLRESVPLIKLPEQVYYMCYRHRNILEQLSSEKGNKKSLQEYADMIGISALALQSLLKYYHIMSNTYEEDKIFMRFDDELPSVLVQSPDSVVEEIAPLDLSGFNVKLKEREEKVLQLRFGKPGNKLMSFKDIGEVMNISEELARQIYHSAINKIKAKVEKEE